jgi:hypothetical protein
MLERVKLVTSNADVSTKLDPYTKVSYSTYVCTSHKRFVLAYLMGAYFWVWYYSF